jgi:hypothetical protein
MEAKRRARFLPLAAWLVWWGDASGLAGHAAVAMLFAELSVMKEFIKGMKMRCLGPLRPGL